MRPHTAKSDARHRQWQLDRRYYWLGITIASAAIGAVGPMVWLLATTH